MSYKIAVILNESGKLTAFERGVVLPVFGKENNVWRVVNEIRYSLDLTSDISDIRNNIRAILMQLDDCKVIVGKTITGLPYNILERMGFEIYEAQSVSDSLLEEINSELETEAAHFIPLPAEVPTTPVETSEQGVFFLNLIMLQEKRPEISSKKALQAFIETYCFYRLDLICSHVPPWFNVILPQKRLTYSVEELEKNQLKVSISKEVC